MTAVQPTRLVHGPSLVTVMRAPSYKPDATKPGELAKAEPSTRAFLGLLKAFRATGGAAPGDVLGDMLQGPQCGGLVALARSIVARRVFAFDWRGELWVPMFQFEPDDLSLAVAPQEVRAELPAILHGWALACWFAQPHAALRGQAPVDMLRCDLPAVLEVARGARSHQAGGATFG